MGKKRKIFIAVVSVLLAAAVVFAVVNSIGRKKNGTAVSFYTACVNGTPSVGDKLYLKYSSSDLEQASDDLWYWTYVLSSEEHDIILVPIRADNSIKSHNSIYAEVQEASPEDSVKIADAKRAIFQDYYDRLVAVREKGIPEDSKLTPEKLDGYIDWFAEYLTEDYYEADKAAVTSYVMVAKSAPNYELNILASTAAAVLLGIILLYAVLGIWFKPGKLVLATVVLVILTTVIGAVCFKKELETMAAIREYAPGMYVCNVTNDYKLDDMLATDIRNSDDMIDAACKHLLGGLPINVDVPAFGCSSFSCVTESGSHIFGRNYDYLDSNGLIVYSHPEGCYESIAILDLQWINMAGASQMIKPDSLVGRFILRGVGPLICVDGMNDQGLGISILTLGYNQDHVDTGNPDTLVPIAIRAVLDKCATVDEAVEFLSSYDVNSMIEHDFHLFVTDKSGKSVVVEWIDGLFTVTEIDHVANDAIATHENDDGKRFKAMGDRLEQTNGVLSIDEALDLLNVACQDYEDTQTEWSCAYDLDHFVLYIYNDNDRENVYIISTESFA